MAISRIQKIQELYNRKSFEHNVFTPHSLVKEIIANVNTSTKDKILVLYSIEFAISLVEDFGLNYDQITLYSQSESKKSICKKVGIKYIESLNEIKNMKFDVVLGNPPYEAGKGAKNSKLWKKFSVEALNMSSNYIAFVTPEGALSDSKNGVSLQKEIKDSGFGYTHAKLHDRDGTNYFKGFGVSTCHWIVKKDTDDTLNPTLFSVKPVIDSLAQSICDKVVSYPKKLNLDMQNGNISRSDLHDAGKNSILFSGDKLSKTDMPVKGNQLKLVFPFSSSYHKAHITNLPTGQLNLFMAIDDTNEGEFILSYTMSPLFRLVAKTYRKTSGFTPFVKNNMIPDLRGKDITDLYSLFNLTQEEIDYVEANS